MAQIPALLISVAAAMVVSRVGKDDDVGSQITQQVFSSPRSLAIIAGVIGVLGADPGHAAPRLPADRRRPRLAAPGCCDERAEARQGRAAAAAPPPSRPNAEASWDDLQPVDTLGLEVGYRLIALVDKARQGDLLARIKGVRRKFAQDVGFLPPPVHIRDNLELKPSVYRLTLRGAVVGEGEAYPGMLLAINPGGAVDAADRHADHRPGVRPAGDVDRGAPARAGADGRIYGR